MTSLILRKWWWPGLAAAALVAGCASNPAPVVNHSFGGGAPAAAPAAVEPAARGAQTFAANPHASGTVSNGEYTVARGDTLYSIAFANGMDVRQLAAMNGLSAPYVIHPGQELKLRPGATGAAPVVATAAAPEAAPIVSAPPAAAPVTTVPPPAAASRQTSAPVFGPVTTQQMAATGVAAAPTAAQPQTSAPVFGPVTTQQMTATGVAAAPAPAESAAGVAAAPAPGATAGAATTPAVPPPPAAPPAATPAPAAAVAAIPTPPPGATRSVAGITWQWPANGKVVGGFRSGSGGDGAGLDIAGSQGDPVLAAAAGTVVYSGNGLIGYGELVIIKHNDTYLSAYGHNSKRLVKEGQHVDAGQEIALMGASGAPRVELHFEIRKDGKPVDPLAYLPQR